MNNEQQPQQADDPSGDGWRWVERNEVLRDDDMQQGSAGIWRANRHAGKPAIDNRTYRRRIEPPQPSDSEPETMDSWEMRLAKMTQWNLELEALVAEAERSGEQVNAELQQLREQVRDLTRQAQFDAVELQQLREQVQTLTRELKDKNDTYQLCLQNHYKAGQRSAIDKLQAWLRPVLEVVSDHPDNTSILAVSVLEFLPQIASRLIEE